MWISTLLLLALGTAAEPLALCSVSTVSPTLPAPSVASGYKAKLIANGLRSPRGIIFDTKGNLLVVEAGHGVTALTLNDQGNDCVGVASKKVVINDSNVGFFRLLIPRKD